ANAIYHSFSAIVRLFDYRLTSRARWLPTMAAQRSKPIVETDSARGKKHCSVPRLAPVWVFMPKRIEAEVTPFLLTALTEYETSLSGSFANRRSVKEAEPGSHTQ